MKLYKYIMIPCAVAMLGLGFTSCDDDDVFTRDGQEAFIFGGEKSCLTVKGNSGKEWSSYMEDNTIYIQIAPWLDPVSELDGVVAKFYLSKGATVTPDPSIPQNFAVDGGVKYTVTSEDGKKTVTYTVTYILDTNMSAGGSGGFNTGNDEATKLFPELGYPGEQGNYGFSDSRQYGDLNGYVAFVGHDHVVLMARQYSAPKFDDPSMNVPDANLAFRVFRKNDLNYIGNLNTGSIPMADIIAMTSDINGVCVAVVANGAGTDLYYWRSYKDAPALYAHLNEKLCPLGDGGNYIQITGDIFGQANITANDQRGASGNHFMIHVEDGQVEDIQTISTGVPSNDCNAFQMISALRTDINSSYLVGDVEGGAGTNNTIRVYANTYSGTTKVTMPNVLQNNWQAWWVGTGAALSRGGGRRPYVSAMVINGKHYAAIMNGTGWWWHNDIADVDDLNTRVPDCTWAYSTNCGWSFGATCAWYWNPETNEGYLVYYTDRYGMNVKRLSCFE